MNLIGAGSTSDSIDASVTFFAELGETFQIQVDGEGLGPSEAPTLAARPASPPANDDFADRIRLAGPAVTIFGSARTKPGTTYYEFARTMGAEVAKLGFTVITGGGPGIMEAGNRGAHEAGGRSIGVNIELPFEQGGNPYVDRSVDMHYFFTRKTILVKYSYAFIVMPGGAGTLDEIAAVGARRSRAGGCHRLAGRRFREEERRQVFNRFGAC